MKSVTSLLALSVATLALVSINPALAQQRKGAKPSAARTAPKPAQRPTLADANKFVADAEKKLNDLSIHAAQVSWVKATYITDDTDALAARVGTEATELSVKYATQAARYMKVPGLSYDTKRKLDILRGGLVLPAPTTAGAAAELNTIATDLDSAYGKGKGTLRGKPMNGSDIEAEMGTNRNPEELKEMWTSWHNNVGAPMRSKYSRMVDIGNQGATELGYKDIGAMWRSGYDMPADEFAALTDKLWLEVKPLYDELHTYTRNKLNAKYGDAVQAKTGPIRADLLGNMWAQ